MAKQPIITVWEQIFSKLQQSGELGEPLVFGPNYRQVIDHLTGHLELNDTYYFRFATLISHSISSPIVLILETFDRKVAVDYCTVRGNYRDKIEKFVSSHNEYFLNLWSGSKKLPQPFALAEKKDLRYVFQLIMPSRDESIKKAIIFHTDEFSDAEQQFLKAIGSIIAQKTREAAQQVEYQKTQKQLEVMTHQMSDGIVVTDSELKIQLWNRPMQRITGFAVPHTVGRHYRDVLLRTDKPDWLREIVANSAGKSNQFQVEFELKPKRGAKVWVQISGSLLKEGEALKQVVMTIRDISREKALEEKKREFISIATHELRTPITALKGYLHLMQKLELSDRARKYLSNAQSANERLARLSEELLQVTKLDENRTSYNIQAVSVKKILEKTAQDFASRAREKGLNLSYEKRFSGTSIVLADPNKLEQVFANLVDNAIKYTQKGSVSISLDRRVDTTTNEQLIVIKVEDTGIGIKKSDQQSIFEKFHRTYEAKISKESGAGLGLFIVKSFIENMHGSIHVTSRQGRGSIFVIIFPALETRKRKKRSE